jgi:hypothetical protein
MMVKLLQGAVVFQFILFGFIGIFVFFKMPGRMNEFGQLVNIFFPIFLSQVIPALIGTPLTEAVRNLTAKKVE